MHRLNRERLEPLYPRYADFVALPRELDPGGKFVNAHVAALFG